jgi:hypothetical protein
VLIKEINFAQQEKYSIIKKDLDQGFGYIDFKAKEIIMKDTLSEVEQDYLLLYHLINLSVAKLKEMGIIKKSPPNLFLIGLTHLLFITLVDNGLWEGIRPEQLKELYFDQINNKKTTKTILTNDKK